MTNPDTPYESARKVADRLSRRPSPAATPLMKDIAVSFEFFPPKDASATQSLWGCIDRLAPLAPRFMSVTYGAGGSTRTGTTESVKYIKDETDVLPAAHLTCVGASQDEVDDVVREFLGVGVRHIVALRGDPVDAEQGFQAHPNGYANAAELVAGIKRLGDFEVSVAAYPEVHPEAISPQADLDNLKRKIDAGANRAITQFFFDTDTYFQFLDRVRDAGITVPVVPGILPVGNYARVKSFAAMCGAGIPDWFDALFSSLDQTPDVRQLVAATVTGEQCMRLWDQGVREFHFYTLNRPLLTCAICHILGVRPLEEPTGGTPLRMSAS